MKIIIVTGASSGIGREFALSTAQKYSPDCMWLIARDKKGLRETASHIECNSEILPLDLADNDSFETIKQKLEKEKPQIHFLVNAAGFGKFGSVESLEQSDAENIINVNIRALTMLTKICIPYIIQGGNIINMSSASGFVSLPYFNIYSASKAYVLNFSQALSFELRHREITVTAVCPYWVATDFIATAQDSPNGFDVNNFLFITYPYKVVHRALNDCRFEKNLSLSGIIPVTIKLLSKILPVSIQHSIWNKVRRLTLPDNQLPPEQWQLRGSPDRYYRS